MRGHEGICLRCAGTLDAEGSERGSSAGTLAWRLMGGQAWRLLDSGRLRSAARLGAALSAVGGSVPALLLSCRPRERPPASAQEVVAGVLCCNNLVPAVCFSRCTLVCMLCFMPRTSRSPNCLYGSFFDRSDVFVIMGERCARH